MLTVLGCIVYKHNPWLVLAASLICGAGSWTVLRLFQRAANTTGAQRIGWHILIAVAAGAAIWCTHFIAMLGFEPGMPIGFDPLLTILSLMVAFLGAAPGFVIAASGLTKLAPLIGGAIVGLSITAIHYTGMMAFRVQGIVSWNIRFLVASIALSVVFSAYALHLAMRRVALSDGYIAAAALLLAIVSLHFTGMTAFRIEPMLIGGDFSNPAALHALAIAVAGMAMIVICAGIASYLIDDSVRAKSYELLRQMALTDSLTGLPNRASFQNRLDFEIELAHSSGTKFALITIDLDDFKEINDLHGHGAGDEVLKTLGQRLQSALRAGEFVKRLGGDEFAAIHRIRDGASLGEFLTRLQTILSGTIKLEDCEIVPSASIGVAIYPDHADDKEKLINNSDLAMYRSKHDLTHSICFFDHEMDYAVRDQRSLNAELIDSLENKQLELYYQVQTCIADGEVTGYEALLRWKHPKRGFVPPSEFIPLAEESGLILKLGEWVLYSACTEAAKWSIPCKVAVNISPIQLLHGNLPRLVLEVLTRTGLPPSRLELEMTETTIFKDKDKALHILRQIRALGVGIALDDFGTGYSSLDTLRTFPFDKIKLDRSFMNEIETSPQSRAIIHAVLALGKCLGVPVLAEGIETKKQLDILVEEGCDEAQGYLFGRPMLIADCFSVNNHLHVRGIS